MINFDEEIEKFKPILEIDKLEDDINSDELIDIIDLLAEIAKDK